MKRFMLIVMTITIAPYLIGCAPSSLCAGVGFAADKYQSRDAVALRVNHHPHYRFDTRLRSDLEDTVTFTDLEAMKREGVRVLTAAQAIAVRAAGNEIDRMSPEAIAFLTKRYSVRNPPRETLANTLAVDTAPRDEHRMSAEHSIVPPQPSAQIGELTMTREVLRQRFSEESQAALGKDLSKLRAATDLRLAKRILIDIEKSIELSVGDRGKIGRAILAAPLFLPATIGAEIADAKALRRDFGASFDRVFVYRPPGVVQARTNEQLASASNEQLARWFAPVIIQQHDPEAPYPPSEDQLGMVHLAGTPDQIDVQIDITHPTVYWRFQEAKINTHEDRQSLMSYRTSAPRVSSMAVQKRKQIVYVAWYPSRPALKSGDSEAGLIDGVVIRLTLDRRNRPAIYEFVRSCGCYHMLYVAEFVEAEARQQFGAPMSGMGYAIQKGGSKRDLFLPSLVPDDGSNPTRPVAYVSGGHHLLMTVEAGGVWDGESRVSSERTYQLKPYDTLTHLPLGKGVASMFGSDGLVHNAGRAAGWLLAPTGMRSAGQPRQLGTMKIRMDAYDYDDPYLLDRQLRLPSGF